MSGVGPDRALKETCRVVRGTLPLIDLHLARLASGGCDETTVAAVREEMLAAVRTVFDADFARLQAIVTPEGEVSVSVDDVASTIDVPGGPNYHLVYVTGPPELPRNAAKPADRSQWDVAMAEARQEGADQAILVDSENNVIDGGTANVWVVYADRAFTPPAPPAIAGVARRLILDRASEAGVRPEVAHIRASDLNDADEVFFSTAVAGARHAHGRGGPVSKRLAGWFEAVFAEAL